jgi:hypothetical protein
LSQIENVAGNVATVTACDGAPVAVTLAAAQGAAVDAPVVEFDCVVTAPGAVEEVGLRSPLSANFGELCVRCGRVWVVSACADGSTENRKKKSKNKTRCARCARPRPTRRALSLTLFLSPHLPPTDMATYHELVKKASSTYRDIFV